MKSAILTLTIVACGAVHTIAAAPIIRNLGTLGGAESTAYDINASGQVTGWSLNAGGGRRAFLYTPAPGGGTMTDLGTFAGLGNSEGRAINNSGQVVGQSTTSNSFVAHAFLYTGTPGSGGTMHDLGTLEGFDSAAVDINSAGQIVGWSSWVFQSDNGLSGFLYTGAPGNGGSMVGLPTSTPGAINDDGQFTYRGKIYTPGPGGTWIETSLGTLGGLLNLTSATAINNAGHVTGSSIITDEMGVHATHAILYTGTPGTVFDLGPLPGHTNSGGWGINDRGDVVGESRPGTGGSLANRPFLYTGTPGMNGQMIDLDAWLDANDPIEGAKWTLLQARAINDSGLITGEGIFNDGPGGLSDGTRAFVLDASSLIPEPSALATAAVAIPALLCRRRIYRVRRRSGSQSLGEGGVMRLTHLRGRPHPALAAVAGPRLLLLLCAGLCTARSAAAQVYVATDRGDFGTLHLGTGAFTKRGSTGDVVVTAMTFAPDGRLYAEGVTDFATMNDRLYTVNPASGAVTPVSTPHGTAGFTAGLVAPGGGGDALLGYDPFPRPAAVFRIPTGGGTVMAVGSSGQAFDYSGTDTLEYGPGGVLYADGDTQQTGADQFALFTVNPASGAWTKVGTSLGTSDVLALIYDGTTLYGVEASGFTTTPRIYTIDTVTGAATFTGVSVTGLGPGDAFNAAAVAIPEPAGLGVLAAAAALCRRTRRRDQGRRGRSQAPAPVPVQEHASFDPHTQPAGLDV